MACPRIADRIAIHRIALYFNVGNGKANAISALQKIASAQITMQVDPARLRPVDIPIIEADISRLQRDTGWEPAVPLEQTLGDTLRYWREAVRQ